ncbi:hypothetical protein GCM10022223_32310 [Kineosporia mesophila]|uniref:DUF2637 domain-containing protein n=1 Tax=Kineosporia mesophila TaxID=566012 RepID=A0ABP6ZQT0_9ACTN|nr:hypothetical protein [Kineosporia mesophila]MCD5354443.1 hypothetical protein [Kineosporia mesophila]
MPKTEQQQSLPAIIAWMRADPDRTGAAVVLAGLGLINLAGSATHVLHVGSYPDVGVRGWMVWTVAGSLEVMAAYAAWEMRRRTDWRRIIPALVLLLTVAFIILANLAAADPHSWAAQLPWAEAFAVAPPISFLSVAAIAETRGWQRASRRSRTANAHQRPAERKATTGQRRQANRGAPTDGRPALPARDRSRRTAGDHGPEPLRVEPSDQDRTHTILRWLSQGHDEKTIRSRGPAILGVSESTIKRELRGVSAHDTGHRDGPSSRRPEQINAPAA